MTYVRRRVLRVIDHYRVMTRRRRVATLLAVGLMFAVDNVLRTVLVTVGLPSLVALAAHYGLMP